jgi:hypothetical protein
VSVIFKHEAKLGGKTVRGYPAKSGRVKCPTFITLAMLKLSEKHDLPASVQQDKINRDASDGV